MEFRILGPLEVLEGGRPLELGGAKQRALLAVLLLERNRPVAVDRLIDALWEEAPSETARKALQVYVARLRKLFGPERLQTRAPGYLLRVDPHEVDVEQFERLRQEGKLHEALSLWRGAILPEFESRAFAQPEIARLDESRLVCLEERIERDLAEGLAAELVGELERLLAEHPLRERLCAQLMLALYRSGRQAESLQTYRDARRALVEELGIEPGKPLQELHQAVLRQDPALDSPAASRGIVEPMRAAFVGRERELGELCAGLEEVIAGRGRLFLLVGEPGIGKSWLAEELIVQARARGARVLIGRCWEAGGAPAYWPWVQALRGYVRETTPEALRAELGAGASVLAQILPELRELLPALPDPAPIESESARFRLFDATCEFLRKASQRRPIVLFLDDLHAADSSSLLLVQFLARELTAMRVLLLGACRDVDPVPGHALKEVLAELLREPVTRRLPLRGLSRQDVSEYVRLTAAELASSELSAALHEETEGNPLFVAETVRLLALEGGRRDGPRVSIPDSVRDVIGRRLAYLSDECNAVLRLAAILGREFAFDVLARMRGVSEGELLETLDEAVAARVIANVPGAAAILRFAHVLIRDTLYEGLTTARRVRLHRLAVEALEALGMADPGPRLAELAHHAIAGSDFERGVRYARQAGDRALALLAPEEAARLYTTALDALELAEPTDEATRCMLLVQLGESEIRAGNSRVSKEYFLEAATLARRIGLASELARAAIGYGGRSMIARAGADERLVPLLEDALFAVPDDEIELRTRLLSRLAGALRDEPSRSRRDALSREAVELARRSGERAPLAYALDGRVAAILGPDTVADCIALGDELCEVAAQIGDPERLVHGLLHVLHGRVLLGELGEADAALDRAARVVDELGQPAQLFQIHAASAMLALARGELADAEALITEGFALGERAQPDMAIAIHRVQRYTLCDLSGNLDDVEPSIRELVASYPARPVFRCVLAHVHARLGRLEEARHALRELRRDSFSGLPFDIEWLYGMSLLAETTALLGETDAASTLYELLVPWSSLTAADHPEGFRGSVSRYLGLLATTLERNNDAEQHFRDAVEANEHMAARPWLAHTQMDYSRFLLARGKTRDHQHARQLSAQAAVTYRAIGMEPAASALAALN